MGADFADRQEVMDEIRALSDEAKGHLSHHVRNSMQTIYSGLILKDEEMIKSAIEHVIQDLEKVGM